jgi:hypothetical protein
MEFSIVGSKGMKDLATYFSDPKNHKDEDKTHVSKEELASAAGKISREADQFINFLSNQSAYSNLTTVQNEGLFNDDQLSLRDMWASFRGTGYDGKPLSAESSKTLDRLGRLMEINRIAVPRFPSKQVVMWRHELSIRWIR